MQEHNHQSLSIIINYHQSSSIMSKAKSIDLPSSLSSLSSLLPPSSTSSSSSSSSSTTTLQRDNEYKELVSNAFNACIPYINELYPNIVKSIPTLGLLQRRTLIRTILAVATVTIDDDTCIQIDNLLKFELNDSNKFDLDSIPPFAKVKQTIVSVWQGNIVRLDIDAIVNAVSNPYCLGCNIPLHACIDSVIHSYDGPRLKNETKYLLKTSNEWKKPLDTGECRAIKAHCLPCKYIIHTKGPTCQEPTDIDKQNLMNCYINSLNLAKSMGLRSIAFCCISSGLHGLQPDQASRIAIDTVRSYLEKIENFNCFDTIVFTVSTSQEFKSYMSNQNLMLKKQSLDIQIKEPLIKKRIMLPLSALKGLHYPWLLNDENDVENSKDLDLNDSKDLHSLKLSTSIEGAREYFSSRIRPSTWKDIDGDGDGDGEDELEMPSFDMLNALKLNSSLSKTSARNVSSVVNDSNDVMNDSLDTKYDWILLTLNSGSRMQQALLNDLDGNINDMDTNVESSYLKKLSDIYNPDLTVMQYILGRTRLSTKLSSIWRGYRERKKLKIVLTAILLIQRAYKRYYIREKLLKFRIELRALRYRSILNIQTLWRRYICRQKFLKLYIEMNIRASVQKYVVIKISRLYRGYTDRKKVNKYLFAVKTLQSYARMKLCRYYYCINNKCLQC